MVLNFLTLFVVATVIQAQRGGGGGVTCPDEGGFTGDSGYTSGFPKAAPLRNNVACIDNTFNVQSRQGTVIAKNVYGPLEAGFTTSQMSTLFNCNSATQDIPGGLDTKLAEEIAEFQCNKPIEVLSDCGGHSNPYHFHERFTCMYSSGANGHSTRFATGLDGRGLYGVYESNGTSPSNLDACNGHKAVTPDSGGVDVYHYHVTNTAPFSIGCFGPATMEQCRSLYIGCSGEPISVTTSNGTIDYLLECPCYDKHGFNTVQAPPSSPTGSPPGSPTGSPTGSPIDAPAGSPTGSPTDAPTGSPTGSPTDDFSSSEITIIIVASIFLSSLVGLLAYKILTRTKFEKISYV